MRSRMAQIICAKGEDGNFDPETFMASFADQFESDEDDNREAESGDENENVKDQAEDKVNMKNEKQDPDDQIDQIDQIDQKVEDDRAQTTSEQNEDGDEEKDFQPHIGAGTTAVLAFIKDDILFVGNAGDSRCILSRAGKAIPMTEDHKVILNFVLSWL